MRENSVNQSFNGHSSNEFQQQADLAKLFIGNVHRSAKEEELRNFLIANGIVIKELVLMKDNVVQGMNRGFAFLTLDSESETDLVLRKKMSPFMGKELDLKRAAPKDSDDPLIHTKTERIFIGGLPSTAAEQELSDYFNDKYGNVGKVTEVIIKKDRISGKSRGFGFVSFENCHVVDKIMLENRRPLLGGKRMEVRKADPNFPINGAPPSEDGSYITPQNAPGGKVRRATKPVPSPYRCNQGSIGQNSRNVSNLRPEPRFSGAKKNGGLVNRPPPMGYMTTPMYTHSDPYYGQYSLPYHQQPVPHVGSASVGLNIPYHNSYMGNPVYSNQQYGQYQISGASGFSQGGNIPSIGTPPSHQK